MDDDSVYVKRCQVGDRVFGVLYDRYLDKIFRFVYYKTFSHETAEDVTSTIFHKALEKLIHTTKVKVLFFMALPDSSQ